MYVACNVYNIFSINHHEESQSSSEDDDENEALEAI